MFLHRLSLAALVFVAVLPVWAQDKPPVAKVEPVKDTYFGTDVVDNYRYLENLKDPYTSDWFKGQAAYSRAVLDKIPGRKALLDRITELDASVAARTDLPTISSGYYFYGKTKPSENVPKIYVRKGLNGTERLLIDPDKGNTKPGSHNAVDYYVPSLDGTLLAYGISPGGSEDAVIHIVDVETGKELSDTIDRAQFGGVSWLPDGKSFLYNRLQKLAVGAPVTDKFQNSRVYLHVLGNDPERDKLIFGGGVSPSAVVAPEDLPFVSVSPGNTKYALGVAIHGVLNEQTAYVAPLADLLNAANPYDVKWTKVCDVPDAVTGFDVQGDDLFLLTHKSSSRFAILKTSLSKPDITQATTVLPAGEAVITAISAAQDGLYVTLRDGGIGRLRRVDYKSGKVETIKLPVDGSIAIHTDARLPGVLFDLTGWTRAIAVYNYADGKIVRTDIRPLGKYDAPTDVVSEEVKAKASDGTLIPLSIVYKKGLKRDGTNPCWLDGYGSYGISTDPFYSLTYRVFMEQGGILASAHVRGGGEYGEDWHRAGMMKTKPNTWNDFIVCAEYLIANKYTSPAKLAGEGTSAGGILIGRAITTRPDLFGVAWINVGSSNMLRAEFGANGVPNIPEFGTVKNEEGFRALAEMDALSHVKDGVKYPAVLLTTGYNDPRVDSWEPGKMAARLQAATASGKPILLRVDYDAGHGIGSTKQQAFQQLVDAWTFMFWQMGLPQYQPKP